MIKSATSPFGDEIEIVPDSDWLALTGTSERGLRSWNLGAKRFVIGELWRNGPVEDWQSGRATGMFWKRMKDTYGDENITSRPIAFPGFASDPLNAPAFDLRKKGKRTYRIALQALPQTWYEFLRRDEDQWERDHPTVDADREAAELVAAQIMPLTDADIATDALVAAESMNGAQAETDAEHDDAFDMIMRDIQLDAPTVYESEPPLDIAIASQVAMSMLTTVVEIISAGTGAAVDDKVRSLTGDLNDALGKLGARLEENDRYRRQLRQAGDEIQALRYERDGLRSRLRATEANLTAALKGDAVQAINGEIQRRVDSIMRVAPTSKGTDD